MNKTITIPASEKNNKIKLHILTDDEYISLIETIETLNDKEQLSRIELALRNISKGKIPFHKDIFSQRFV